VEGIAVDETLFKRGQSYVTAIVDAQARRVIDVEPGRAFRMVQALDVLYASPDEATADARFDDLFRWLRRSRLEPMKNVALTLKRYRDEILNFFATRITNAICEGINSMIQAAKRKARGYHTFEGFATMIFLSPLSASSLALTRYDFGSRTRANRTIDIHKAA
jgi:transposase